ncbi:MAG: carbon starvation CstA family protein [Eubacteriales bacterium]|nr:carbon starvation CstA family protein [Eubacteriales bacterium]
MNGLTIMVIAIVVLVAAYLLYGRWIANTWGIDPKAKTPAYELEDGVDYVPADRGVVFGHQFASIAGAGPINGPIQAAIFGWVPVLLWCLLGGVFFGAVQDFSAMYASVKNKGHTIGVIIELYVGKLGKKLFLLFCWLFSILVVAAFADIVAGTFNGFAEDGSQIAANASVATTSILFIVAAVGLGFFLKYTHFSSAVNTVVAIALLVACVALGLLFPVYQTTSFWHIFVFVYVFVASIVPVWALLQPRDYLNSYLLVAMIVAAVVGIVVYNPSMNLPTFTAFNVNGSYLFPTLFVTIACGAISGFHSLVSSGTASKQIKNERDMLPVSFGAMLMESMLAIISLVCVGFLASGATLPEGTPPQIFASAIATFLTKLGIPETFSSTLILLAVSAFGLTSLDSVARVGRLSFQEFFVDADTDMDNLSPVVKVCSNKYVATAVTLVLAYALAKMGYANIWPLFGSANQLLGALSLIACAVFLKHTHRKGFMLLLPMICMLAITFTALLFKIVSLTGGLLGGTSVNAFGDGLQLVFAALLFALGIVVAIMGIRKLLEKKTPELTSIGTAK